MQRREREGDNESNPHIVVFSSLFPHRGAPYAGLFIRERMFRVGKTFPITVVSPQPWFPLQKLISRFRAHYRPAAPARELQGDVEVLYPRFFAFPGLLRQFDGFFMAVCSFATMRRLKKEGRAHLIDAHFGYPDGYAATLLGRWLKLPVTITLRGTEISHSAKRHLRPRLISALQSATRLFSVSASLRDHAVGLGVPDAKIRVVGNGVDVHKFRPENRMEARARFKIPSPPRVLVSVGGLVERKGFHRVIDCLPSLLHSFPDLQYLIVGGASAEGDMSDALKEQVSRLKLETCVRFLGPMPSEELRWPLSAADVFVLATRNEGWANVFLEAMACGLPVVTTDVGGNREVVCYSTYGNIVPYGDHPALESALQQALSQTWDRASILAYARDNDWAKRIAVLVEELGNIAVRSRQTGCADVTPSESTSVNRCQ